MGGKDLSGPLRPCEVTDKRSRLLYPEREILRDEQFRLAIHLNQYTVGIRDFKAFR